MLIYPILLLFIMCFSENTWSSLKHPLQINGYSPTSSAIMSASVFHCENSTFYILKIYCCICNYQAPPRVVKT